MTAIDPAWILVYCQVVYFTGTIGQFEERLRKGFDIKLVNLRICTRVINR